LSQDYLIKKIHQHYIMYRLCDHCFPEIQSKFSANSSKQIWLLWGAGNGCRSNQLPLAQRLVPVFHAFSRSDLSRCMSLTVLFDLSFSKDDAGSKIGWQINVGVAVIGEIYTKQHCCQSEVSDKQPKTSKNTTSFG